MEPTRPTPGAAAVDDAVTEAELVAAERLQAEQERAERARRRMRQTVRDMVLSLLVVGVVVVLIAQPWRQTAAEQPIRVVSWQPVAEAFATSVEWRVLTPRGVPSGWVSTSARIEPTVDGRTALHIGWITAGQQYAALEQSDTADVNYVRDSTGGAAATGTSYAAAGSDWQRLEAADGTTRSLVLRSTPTGEQDQVTYVVTGSAQWPELEGLASSLR